MKSPTLCFPTIFPIFVLRDTASEYSARTRANWFFASENFRASSSNSSAFLYIFNRDI